MALGIGMEWPWVARIRWWDGFWGSGKGGEEEEGLVAEEGGVEVGRGIRAKRCLAFVRTMDKSSGKVTFREERRGQESCGGVSFFFSFCFLWGVLGRGERFWKVGFLGRREGVRAGKGEKVKPQTQLTEIEKRVFSRQRSSDLLANNQKKN